MTAPYFTIVIPTRNRPQYILDTVISAVSQEFDDFEVILSDNSSDDKTRAAFAAGGLSKDVRYIKPPHELSMPDHWEFATLQARGKYVLVLTDRSVLRQGALATIYRAIANSGLDSVQVCSWRWALFDEEEGALVSDEGYLENARGNVVDAVDVALAFVGPQKEYPYTLPRALNSCYSAEIAERIRALHGRLFFPINPDFASAFFLLAYVDKLLYIDSPLFISQGLGISNGGNAYKGDGTGYMQSLKIAEWYRHVPIKEVLVENIILEDFLMARDVAGGNLLKVEMDWVEYFVRCHREIQEKKRAGILNQQQIDRLENAWSMALGSMGREIGAKVGKHLRTPWLVRVKGVVRQVPLVKVLHKHWSALRSPAQAAVTQSRTTVLEAAGHKGPKVGK